MQTSALLGRLSLTLPHHPLSQRSQQRLPFKPCRNSISPHSNPPQYPNPSPHSRPVLCTRCEAPGHLSSTCLVPTQDNTTVSDTLLEDPMSLLSPSPPPPLRGAERSCQVAALHDALCSLPLVLTLAASALSLAALPAAAAPHAPPSPRRAPPNNKKAAPTTGIYTVRSGDSLWTIAADHDLTVSDLKALNPGITDDIWFGQKVVVAKPIGQRTQWPPPPAPPFDPSAAPPGGGAVGEHHADETAGQLASQAGAAVARRRELAEEEAAEGWDREPRVASPRASATLASDARGGGQVAGEGSLDLWERIGGARER